MSAKVWIDSITFNDGTQVPISQGQITVLVGPNNAGKSGTLKELYSYLTHQNFTGGVIVKDYTLQREGTFEEVETMIQKSGRKEDSPSEYYSGLEYRIHQSYIKHFWEIPNFRLHEIGKFFAYMLTTEGRLSAVTPPTNIKFRTESLTHPIQLLYINDKVADNFSNYFKQAFGLDLFVDHLGGSEVPLHIGHKPAKLAGEETISATYNQRLKLNPLLHEQGDGMKSFVGVLLYTLTTHHQIHFIDEPEAFLHPPQARLMGKMLGQDLPKDKQLFIATHSSDMLKGLLEAKAANIQVIRINRDDKINRISRLPKETISEVWNNSLLRHSNVFEGIFHSKVVLCEGDADCRFYSAVLDAVHEKEGMPSPDVHFIHCGGKHRMDVVIRALHQLNVPLSVIADFDVLNAEQPLRKIYEALGGNWINIQNNWTTVKKAVDGKKAVYDLETAKREIRAALDEVTHKEFTKEAIMRINHLMKQPSPWSIAKEVGISFVPSAEEFRVCKNLLKDLSKMGLFVVEVGHLECFNKEINGYGPVWAFNVLQKDLQADPNLEQARQFVKRVISLEPQSGQ